MISLIPDKSEFLYKATIDGEKVKYIKVGDSIQITLAGKQVPIDNVVVKSVRNVDDGKSMVEIIAEMPDGTEASNGMSASMKHVKKTDEYDCIIPICSLRSTNQGDYILVVKETNTVLGNEKSAYKLEVTVADKDSSFAAVTGVLNDEKIIINSNKPISEGDRVRIDVK